MTISLEEGVVLWENELQVLLQSQEIETFFGFSFHQEAMGREQLIMIVSNMARKGFLEFDDQFMEAGDRYRLCPVLAAFASAVRYGEQTVIFTGGKSLSKSLCVYPYQDGCAVLEVFPYRKNSFRIRWIELDEITDFLEEAAFFPTEYELDSRELNHVPRGTERRNSLLLRMVCYCRRSNEKTAEITIYESGIYRFIEWKDGNGSHQEVYTTEKIRQKIKDRLRGNHR